MTEIRTTINTIITKNYKGWLMYATKLSTKKDDPYDILNESLLVVLEKTDTQLTTALPYFEGLVKVIIKRNCHSKTSAYQQKYNKIPIQELTKVDIDYILIDEEEEDKFHNVSYEDIEKFLRPRVGNFATDIFMRKSIEKITYAQLRQESIDVGIPGIPISSMNAAYLKAKRMILKEFKMEKT